MTKLMTPDSFFRQLDIDKDGRISRSDLYTAAERMGWHWQEAPIFALLDFLTISEPITEKQFSRYLRQIADDPMGPYGKVLLNAPGVPMALRPKLDRLFPHERTDLDDVSNSSQRHTRNSDVKEGPISALDKNQGAKIANRYHSLLETLDTRRISTDDAALLIIDPQRSFTEGVWMQSIGVGAAIDVEPIVIAFNNIARLLKFIYGHLEIMFTRCPFPPGSYDWDNRLAGIIDRKQIYFIKPGNSALFPPLNGFRDWLEFCINKGIGTLIMGGCTLNSCVRVSSIETANRFRKRNIRVIVDLSICGARLRNYLPSSSYKNVSAVESAIRQMTAANVQVVRRVEWQ